MCPPPPGFRTTWLFNNALHNTNPISLWFNFHLWMKLCRGKKLCCFLVGFFFILRFMWLSIYWQRCCIEWRNDVGSLPPCEGCRCCCCRKQGNYCSHPNTSFKSYKDEIWCIWEDSNVGCILWWCRAGGCVWENGERWEKLFGLSCYYLFYLFFLLSLLSWVHAAMVYPLWNWQWLVIWYW